MWLFLLIRRTRGFMSLWVKEDRWVQHIRRSRQETYLELFSLTDSKKRADSLTQSESFGEHMLIDHEVALSEKTITGIVM